MDQRVSEIEDCISISERMSLEAILSGLIILASKGSISNRFSNVKNGFLNKYLMTSSFFLLPISFFSSSEVTLRPFWNIKIMAT